MDNIQTEEIKKTAAEIASTLEGIGSNSSKNANEIVFLLEDHDFLEREFKISQRFTKQYKSIELRYQGFCKAYLMMLFLEFIPNEHDAEIVLMQYGYLQDFANPKMKERYQEYWEYSHTYSERIMGKNRGDKGNLFREAINDILEELADTLSRIMLNSNGKLGFAEDVLKEFTNNAIPEKLSLPITEYFTHTYIHEEEQKKNIDKQIIKDNKPAKTTIRSASDPKTKRKNKFRTMLSKNLPHIKNIFWQRKKPYNNKVYRFYTIIIFFMGNNKESGAGQAKIVKAIYFLAGTVLVSGILIACTAGWAVKKKGTSTFIASDTSAINSILSSAEAYTDDRILVEMETFSIDEDDKCFPLAPGYSRKLPIKNPEPSDADTSTLKVESSDEDVVWEKNGYLTASDNIPEGETSKVYITITAKKHAEIICITVENTAISDDVKYPVGGGNQNY